MRRIGSIVITNASPKSTVTPPMMGTEGSVSSVSVGSIFNIQRSFRTIRASLGILNDFEPLNSTDPPSPPNANFYKGDDFIYHRVNGLWKRSAINKFNL